MDWWYCGVGGDVGDGIPICTGTLLEALSVVWGVKDKEAMLAYVQVCGVELSVEL